jgi:hypothetical protein
VVEPMIDLHQAPHNTKMIEMRRCHLDVPLGKKVQLVCAIALFASIPCTRRGPPSPSKLIFTAFRWWMAAGEAMCGSCSINDWRSLGVDVQTVKKVLASWGPARYDAEARPFAPTGCRRERSFHPHSAWPA